MKKGILVPAVLVLLFLTACGSDEEPVRIGDTLTIITDHGEIPVQIEIADEEAEHQRGLMGRAALEEDAGMLFVFEKEKYLSFWMKDTKIPLDILFINEDGSIVDMQTMPICLRDPCPAFRSRKQAQYALEVNAGFAEEHSIRLGDSVRFS